jgi:hypothetical protein
MLKKTVHPFKDAKDINDFKKIYYLKVDDDVIDSKRKFQPFTLYFKLKIVKKASTIKYAITMMAWSNKEQKNVKLEKSFYEKKYVKQIKEHFTPIAKMLLIYLSKLDTPTKIKEFMYQAENPFYIFHYKILKSFSKKELKRISKYIGTARLILNIPLLKHMLYIFNQTGMIQVSPHLILPDYMIGLYSEGMEMSVDLNNEDKVLIEQDNGKIINSKKFIKKISK